MKRPRQFLPVGLAASGLLAIVIGVHADLLHARPMYDFTITTGWGRTPGQPYWIHPLNHEERLMVALAGGGLLGSIAAIRWRRAAALPVVVGGIVLIYPVRAVLQYFDRGVLYTGIPGLGAPEGQVVLGAEPYLLVLGSLLLIGAGSLAWRLGNADERATGDDVANGPAAGRVVGRFR